MENMASIDIKKDKEKIYNDPPDTFLYVDDNYYFFVTGMGDSLEIDISPSADISKIDISEYTVHSVDSKNVLKKDKNGFMGWQKNNEYCYSFCNKSDWDLIMNWKKRVGLKDEHIDSGIPFIHIDIYSPNLEKWWILISPIIGLFSIKKEIREDIYRKFRKVTILRLKKLIKEYEKIIKKITISYPGIVEEFIERKYEYDMYLEKLQKERTGYLKFLYPLIRPAFLALERCDMNAKEQVNAIKTLFKLGNFDDFDKKYRKKFKINGETHYEIDEELEFAYIAKIREASLKTVPKPVKI